MPVGDQPLVFDGHNDTLQMLYLIDRDQNRSFFLRSDRGHIDLPRAIEGGFGGGLFSVFIPSQSPEKKRPGEDLSETITRYDIPMASSLPFDYAQQMSMKGVASLYRLEETSQGQVSVVRTVAEVLDCFQKRIIAAVLHFEGAEAIDAELDALYVFYKAGLRSLGITWSRINVFAHGVPYKFPHSPDTGPGLTEAGKELVRACNRIGILLDVAHLNEKGFWDIEKLSDAPLVASHSGVHALCPSTRNLTDKQLDAIGASGGIVGVNFHVAFLRADGRLDEDTPIMEIVRHIDYIAHRIGIEHVALGSDFDGATMPQELRDVAGLPKLLHALCENGYDHDALEKLSHRNWIRVLRKTWKE